MPVFNVGYSYTVMCSVGHSHVCDGSVTVIADDLESALQHAIQEAGKEQGTMPIYIRNWTRIEALTPADRWSAPVPYHAKEEQRA